MSTLKHRNVGGRPLRFQTREELINILNEYFNNTPFDEYSITGLALVTGTSKQLLNDYQARAEFKDIIDEAKLIVEHSYEIDLRKKGGAGTIFALKNFDWKDKTESEVTGKDGKDLFPQPILDVVSKDHSNSEDNQPQ